MKPIMPDTSVFLNPVEMPMSRFSYYESSSFFVNESCL